MITITILKNPFNHNGKEIHTCEYVPGKTAYEYVQPYIMGLDDYVVSVSGTITADAKEQVVDNNDWIAVCPVIGNSKWGKIFASLLIGGLTGNLFKMKIGELSAFASGMASTAVGLIGGALLNHWFPPPKPDIPDIDPSYSWSNTQALTGQGNALAVTYGTMRTGGQILAQHVLSKGEDQYLNILLCGGEGPIDSISDVRINGNPVSYYKDTEEPEIRLGANDQPVIANFNDSYVDQALAYELEKDDPWITHQTEGNAVQGLEITLQFPGGLYQVKDDGGLKNASVTVHAQYSRAGADDWKDLTSGEVTIAKASNTPFQVTYKVDNLTADRYEVRARCVAKSGISTRYSTRVFWVQLSSIIYDDFARPGKVLVGIKALATNQLSGGMPSITWLQTRNNVWVWNPHTGQYQQKPATNPAWAAYDIIHRCRWMMNVNTHIHELVVQGAPAARLVYQDFANWAAFCDERDLTFNYIFTTASDLWTALQKPESVGRGKVILRGTKYGCVCDAPGEPVQLFTVGNILTDKFQETFLGLKDRANAIEITFANKDKRYEKDVITAYADDYDASTEPNITQITLDGITTAAQAYREGKYRLRLNRYLTRTVEHSADIDAIACQINDVVLLAHDVPQWGFSGRLLTATPTTLQLDREVTLLPGKSYAAAVQITNPAAAAANEVQTIVTVGVRGVAAEVTTDTLTLTEALTTVPQPGDLYSFGETNKIVKPFRVLSISRDQDLRRKITCLEYIEEIYDEATDIPELNYSQLETMPEVSSVSAAEETYRQKDGTVVSNLNVAWVIPRNKPVHGYKVFYSTDEGQTWSEWGVTGMTASSASIPGVKTQTTYVVKVCAVNHAGVVSPGVQALPVYVTGKYIPPADVPSLTATIDPSDRTKIILTWPAVTDADLKGYQLREGATVLTPTPLSDIRYVYTADESRTYLFSVVAVDNSGNLSEAPAVAAPLAVKLEPPDVSGFTAVTLETDRSQLVLTWQPVNAQDLSHYEIRQGNSGWDAAVSDIVATQLKSTRYVHALTDDGSKTYMIKAVSAAGHYSVQATATPPLQIKLAPDAPTAISAGQDPQDRSVVLLSWTGSGGKDIAGYELKYSNGAATVDIDFTRELSYRWKPPGSGVYTVMIRAQTIAGRPGPYANKPVSVVLEPADVTGFHAVQSDTDRRRFKFSWDGISDTDFAFYEIRRGIGDFAGLALVATQIGTTYYDYAAASAADEGTHTFAVKAVNRAGKYSLGAAAATVAIDLTPSRPGSGMGASDPGNRFKLNLSWDKVADLDVDYYEVSYGGNVVAKCKETVASYTVAGGGTHSFAVRTKNLAGKYSSPLQIIVPVVAEPADVAYLTVAQSQLDKTLLDFSWPAATASDFSHYILKKGNNWDAGELVATDLRANTYRLKAAASGAITYLVKSVNKAGKESVTAAAATLHVVLEPSKPAGGSIGHDPLDKSILIVAWNAVNDADLLQYEVSLSGVPVFAGKETSFRYSIAANGQYDFIVKAKNVGNYYSEPLALSIAATINPSDVTGFSGVQSASDHSKGKLFWHAIPDKDLSHYWVRKGATWDSAVDIATNITGTAVDIIIENELQTTYWVAAVNKAKKISLNPASLPNLAFNLNPANPGKPVIAQDPNDRSILNICWTGIQELDLMEYELRAGAIWGDAQVIARTKELYAVYRPAESGTYTFLLKARNNADYYSDEMSESFAALLEPSDVTGFRVFQNGEKLAFVWDASPDNDVVGYELREGSSFENGTVIATGIPLSQYQLTADTEITRLFHVKAINRSGHYSRNEASEAITITNLPARNVIQTYDEISLKSGIHSGTEFGQSQFTFSTLPGTFADYQTTKFSDIGGAEVLKLQKIGGAYHAAGVYTCARKDMGQVITANITTVFQPSILYTAGTSAALEYRLSRDAELWTDWQPFQPLEATFRYADFRVLLGTQDTGQTPEINQLSIRIDVPDKDIAKTATIAPGGTSVPYGHVYYSVPVVTPTAIGENLYAQVISKTVSACIIKVKNTANADVGGTVDVRIKGY